MAEAAEPDRAVLQQIAEALGVPVERFFTTAPDNTEKLLYFWSRIRTDDGRRRALETLRAIADENPA